MPPAVRIVIFACLVGTVVCRRLSLRTNLPVADTIFPNGTIHTLDAESNTIVAGAIAITSGSITCVGEEEACKPAVGSSTKVVDLHGKSVIPGLTDAHILPIDGGRAMLECTLRFQQLTQEALRTIIQACIDRQPGETGLPTVTEFDHEGFTVINGPGNKSMLDSLNTTRPVAIIASNQHNVFVNSKTLQKTNFTRDSANPPGGRIGRDTRGELNGFLEENAALSVRILGSDRSISQVDAAITALSQLRHKGIITLLDALQVRHDAWTTLKARGDLTARVFSNFGIIGSVDFPIIVTQAVEAKKALDEGILVADAAGQHW